MPALDAHPLTAAAFAPFGEVVARPQDFGRLYTSEALASGRPRARASLSIAKIAPYDGTTVRIGKMERHEFSSQSFVPIDVSRYLILVAPHGADGKLDPTELRAFLARGDQAITYGLNVWHAPMTVLDGAGHFAIFMWLDGSTGDEEFVDLTSPASVSIPVLQVPIGGRLVGNGGRH